MAIASNVEINVLCAGMKTTVENFFKSKGLDQPLRIYTLEEDGGSVLQGDNSIPVFTEEYKAGVYLSHREDLLESQVSIKERNKSWFLRLQNNQRKVVVNPETKTDSHGCCNFVIS